MERTESRGSVRSPVSASVPTLSSTFPSKTRGAVETYKARSGAFRLDRSAPSGHALPPRGRRPFRGIPTHGSLGLGGRFAQKSEEWGPRRTKAGRQAYKAGVTTISHRHAGRGERPNSHFAADTATAKYRDSNIGQ